MHLLGECLELIRFGATLTQFWPSSDQKWLEMYQNGGFLPLSEKVFTQSNSKLCCKLVRWFFRSYSLWAMLAQFWASRGQKHDLKWVKIVVSDHYLKKIFMQSNSNLVCTLNWVGVQNWFALGPRWPNFGPLVATKWLKMAISDHYLNKYHYLE